jgi:hypothetical protein
VPTLQLVISDKLLDSGQYQNPTEVLLTALELLQHQELAPVMSFGVIDQQNQFVPLIRIRNGSRKSQGLRKSSTE